MAKILAAEALENPKKTEQKLILSEKSVALTNLVAGIAHEINTPIGICITAISYLQEKNRELNSIYKSGEMKKSEFERYLNSITEITNSTLSNLSKASNLIKNFKMVAVNQANEEKRIFNIKEYIDDVILTLIPELKKRKYEIKLNCQDNLLINSYPGTLSQIITNLVMNSLIHGYDEGDKVALSFAVTKEDNHILFQYADDGKGINKEIQDKIFDAFFTTKGGNGSSGLGLHIVYNLVTQTLGGTISCESNEGIGTVFTITIPIQDQKSQLFSKD
jgi:Signal transduction histidine kinase